MVLRYSPVILALILAAPVLATTTKPPRVVASIAPLHSLVAGIMQDVAEPELLIKGGTSPHSHNLRPSQMRALSRARVIFWVGERMEWFLRRPLSQPSTGQKIIAVANLPGLLLLPARHGGIWENHSHSENTAKTHKDIDNHIWLDPENAKIIAQEIAITLSKIDPDRAAVYQENTIHLIARLNDLHLEIMDATAATKKPYLVFHDAYQYFEQRYQLKAIGSVTVSPDRKPGARRLQEIQQKLRDAEAHCIFSEPQFPASQLNMLTEDGKYYSGELDPIGIDIPPGPDMYFILMRRLASSFVACLNQRH